MWENRSNRILEVVIIVLLGAIVSLLNTLWLKNNLIKEVKKIAKTSEENIVNTKVTDIASKMR